MRRKVTTVIITAELEIEDDLIYDKHTLVQDLLGQYIKIKSGGYENVAAGNVTSVSVK
jgi:hypothetical protein